MLDLQGQVGRVVLRHAEQVLQPPPPGCAGSPAGSQVCKCHPQPQCQIRSTSRNKYQNVPHSVHGHSDHCWACS
jgi:hypothetical protein